MADKLSREDEADLLAGMDMLYDCKHLEMKFPDGQGLERARALLSEHWFESGEVPSAIYHCGKLRIACPYMHESAVMAERGEPSRFSVVHTVNLERALDCEHREDTEDTRIRHAVPRITFLTRRFKQAIELDG